MNQINTQYAVFISSPFSAYATLYKRQYLPYIIPYVPSRVRFRLSSVNHCCSPVLSRAINLSNYYYYFLCSLASYSAPRAAPNHS